MTVRVVGWLDKDGDPWLEGRGELPSATCTPFVLLPAVIEALEACWEADRSGWINATAAARFLAELKQLTTPADAGGRVK